ncbi:uncharacterized protein METZ01_LOCUS407077 [marine metagenome]|jgi:hypothetical protein|uniref:Uncharacterized protein n=1 Tax=marine metagenome TaxID=408172 RepID=A0A382W613_9ZZZZ
MARICPVCDKEISKFSLDSIQGVDIHDTCREAFYKNPEKYGAVTVDEERKATAEQRRKQQEEKSVYKSVYIKGGIDVKSFDMPFGDMVMFMVKWAIASIPAFIILFIIGAILTGIFGSLIIFSR